MFPIMPTPFLGHMVGKSYRLIQPFNCVTRSMKIRYMKSSIENLPGSPGSMLFWLDSMLAKENEKREEKLVGEKPPNWKEIAKKMKLPFPLSSLSHPPIIHLPIRD
jgi:hypothetical protein